VADYPVIQGNTAHSWNEVYVARALDKLKLQYTYQYQLGFRGVRGDYAIDFVVYNPFPVPVEIYGEYWHTGQLGADDRLRQSIIENKFGRELVVIWGNESDSQEKADQIVRQKLG
jgi:hypothetical protein